MTGEIDTGELVHECWKRGLLSWKLKEHQRPLYASARGGKTRKFVMNCARRFGKSTVFCLYALETGLRLKNAQIHYAAPTAKALRKIIRPIIAMLIEDAPEDLRPKWNAQESAYFFPSTGSVLHLAGADNDNADSLRGTATHLGIIDEAGFMDNALYLLKDILLPQTLTTNGRILIGSTPPKTPAHDFSAMVQEAVAGGYYAKYTIWDNTSLTREKIDEYAKEAGCQPGKYDSTTWKREYECEFVVDSESRIVPEWKDDYIVTVPRTDPNFEHWHRYVSMDMGVVDYTAILFGYYDFKRATLVVEDEIVMNGPDMTTVKLAETVKGKEAHLWGDKKPYRRIADCNNPLLLQDLGSLNGLHFVPTQKEQGLAAMVNETRIFIAGSRLEVHPRCQQLTGCLRFGVWDEKRKEFGRSAGYGHYDALAALVYLIRNIDQNTNPVPPERYEQRSGWLVTGARRPVSPNARVIGGLFRPDWRWQI